MAERTLHPTHLIDAALDLGPNKVRERTDLMIHSYGIPLEGEAAFADALQSAFGLALPDHRLTTQGTGVRAIRTGPDQVFLLFETEKARDSSAALGAHAYMTDQTDGWVTLDIDGRDTLAALERMCMLDLSPERFPLHASARTVMHHVGVLIVRLDDNRFLLLTPRSSARSFIHALSTSFGNVTIPDRP